MFFHADPRALTRWRPAVFFLNPFEDSNQHICLVSGFRVPTRIRSSLSSFSKHIYFQPSRIPFVFFHADPRVFSRVQQAFFFPNRFEDSNQHICLVSGFRVLTHVSEVVYLCFQTIYILNPRGFHVCLST